MFDRYGLVSIRKYIVKFLPTINITSVNPYINTFEFKNMANKHHAFY